MSLNNIKLSPHLMAELYPDSLIELFARPVPETLTVKYLGNNEKNILIVVSDPSLPFLNDSDLQLLTTILSACKLSLADVAIVNFYNSGVALFKTSMDSLKPKNILLFGIDPLSIGLPINFPHFQIQKFSNSTYVYSPDLSQINQDKSLKTKLWLCLKSIFNL